MKNTLTDNIISQLSGFIASNLALHFPKERWGELERNIISASKEFGYNDVEKFIQHIISSPLTREHVEVLATSLTISETYFWREPQTFEALEQIIIPGLIRQRQKGEERIRIWSAGCSTGEEPYSIAIAIRRLIPDIEKWNITILASDINPKILQKANAGVYNQWSFRSAPQWLKERYFFRKEKEKYEILPEIKNMVTFEYLNLAEDVFPSPLNNTNAMDIIFCRNVLMYFTHERASQVVKGLFNSLVEGGYLIVGASELSYHNFPQFAPVSFSGGIVYRKNQRDSSQTSGISFVEMLPQKELVEAKLEPEVNLEHSVPLPKAITEVMKQPVGRLPLQSKYEEALNLYSKGYYHEVIDKLEKQVFTPGELMLLVRAYANQGKLKDAIALCEKAIAADKLDPRMHYLYATILHEHNQLNEATASLKHAIYLDPDFVLSYYSLGNIFLCQGNLPGAKKCYKNVLSILEKYSQDEILPESEGLTAGRFREIILATIQTRAL
jgi:chemotaxis protein methyltransferase CheR